MRNKNIPRDVCAITYYLTFNITISLDFSEEDGEE